MPAERKGVTPGTERPESEHLAPMRHQPERQLRSFCAQARGFHHWGNKSTFWLPWLTRLLHK